MPAIDLSATPYYSMVISLAKSPLFSIAIHPMSVVHCKKVNRFRQVCHHWGPLGSANFIREIRVVRLMPNRSAPPTRPLLCEVGSGSHLGVKAEFRAFIKSFRPMQRMGIPDDVANVAEYLAGDPAAFASGQHLLVAGGAPA